MLDMKNVVRLPVVTDQDSDPKLILATAAAAEDLKKVIVIGEREDGSLYFESSQASGPEVLWLMEQLKRVLLRLASLDPGEPQ